MFGKFVGMCALAAAVVFAAPEPPKAEAGGFGSRGRGGFFGRRGRGRRNRGQVVIINNGGGGFGGYGGGGFGCNVGGFGGYGGGGFGGYGGGVGGFQCNIGQQFAFNDFVVNRRFFENRLGAGFVQQVLGMRGSFVNNVFQGQRFVRDRIGRLFAVNAFGARRIQ